MTFAVFGSPIAHSLSPFIHESFARQYKINIDYQKIEATADDFEQKLNTFIHNGGQGANITSPLKEIAYQLAHTSTSRCEAIQATNTLSFAHSKIQADNTDGYGFYLDCQHLSIPINNQRVLILGSGGATQALLPILHRYAHSITIATRNPTPLTTPYAQTSTYENLKQSFDLIIHATPLGFQGKTPPLPDKLLGGTYCYDLAYGQAHQPFAQWARQHGAHSIYSGLGMLIEQAAEAFRVWFGMNPDTTSIRNELSHLFPIVS